MSGFQSAIGGGQGSGKPVRSGTSAPPQKKPASTEQHTEKSHWWQFGLTTWLLIIGLAVINAGMFVKPELLESLGGRVWRLFSFFDIRFWPWWYWPIFWIVIIGIVIRYLLGERITVADYNKEPSDQLRQLRRLVTIVAVGLTGVLVVVHTRLAVFLSGLLGNLFSSNAPWWAWPTVWTFIIIGLLTLKIIMAARESRFVPATAQVAPVKQKTFNAATAPARKTFNAVTGVRQATNGSDDSWIRAVARSAVQRATLVGPMVWWSVGGVIVFILVAWVGYWYTTTEWIDKEGYPISKPWWIWPLLCALIGCGGVAIKMIIAVREAGAEGAFRSGKPKPKPVKPQKPIGFNVPRKK